MSHGDGDHKGRYQQSWWEAEVKGSPDACAGRQGNRLKAEQRGWGAGRPACSGCTAVRWLGEGERPSELYKDSCMCLRQKKRNVWYH